MLIDQYIEYLKTEAGLSENTVVSYCYDIESFCTYLRKRKKSAAMSDSTDILSYILYMKNNGKSTATILRNVAAVKNYFKFLSQQGILKQNPCDGIELPKHERKVVEKPTKATIMGLMNMIKKDSIKGMRDYAMVSLVATCGMQASEMIELDMENFIIEDSLIIVKKSHSEQIYPLPAEVKIAIENYVTKCRPLIVSEDESALFLNASGKRMTRQGFWKIVRQYKDNASIEVQITPRNLRYSLPS